MKHVLLLLSLAIPLTSAAQAPAGPPPSRPPSTSPGKPPPSPPAPAPSTSGERAWSTITVQSIKPTMSARNVFVIKGFHAHAVAGGWTVESSYQLSDATKVVQITLAAHAAKDAGHTRHQEKVDHQVDIKELAGPAYSGKPGKFDVVVVDRDGKELARTIYEVK